MRIFLFSLISGVVTSSRLYYGIVVIIIMYILGEIGENIVVEAKIFALSLLNRKPRPSIISFVNLLEDASKKLYDQHISPFEFLNKLTAANVDNQLIDETWGLEHSRVDLQPESEEYDEEDIDSAASETVDSDAA